YLEEALAGHGAGLPDGPPLMPPERLAGFVAAQLVWDRALAEGIVAARALPGSPLVAALIGRGHLEYGYGVPGQLRALGMEDAAILLTAAPGERIPAGIADAVFVTTEADPPAP